MLARCRHMLPCVLAALTASAFTSPAPAQDAALNEGLASAEMQKTIAALGSEATPNSSTEFAAYIAAQHRKWIEFGKAAGVQVN